MDDSHPYEQCGLGNVTADANSLKLRIGMGQAGFGRIGGGLMLYAPKPFPELITPEALTLDAVEGHEIVRDAATKSIQQFVSAASIANVIRSDDGNGYRLEYFVRTPHTEREGDSGTFVTAGDPVVSIRVFSPDGAPALDQSATKVRIVRTANGSEQVSDYEFNDEESTWSLANGDSDRIESVKTVQADDLSGYTKVRRVVDSTGTLRVHVIEEYQRLICGDRKVREIIDPEGEALTTTWEYGVDPELENRGSLGRLLKVVRPNGDWTRYEYDSLGRLTKTITPHLNAPVNAERLCRVTETQVCCR
ncbi:MAG: RHS repeat domain-containing protein [Verrucomicrobiales bacterium]